MHWREGKRNPKKMVKRCPNLTELPHFWKTAFLDCTQRDKTPEEYFKEEDEMDTLFNIFKHNSEICINGREIIDKHSENTATKNQPIIRSMEKKRICKKTRCTLCGLVVINLSIVIITYMLRSFTLKLISI